MLNNLRVKLHRAFLGDTKKKFVNPYLQAQGKPVSANQVIAKPAKRSIVPDFIGFIHEDIMAIYAKTSYAKKALKRKRENEEKRQMFEDLAYGKR